MNASAGLSFLCARPACRRRIPAHAFHYGAHVSRSAARDPVNPAFRRRGGVPGAGAAGSGHQPSPSASVESLLRTAEQTAALSPDRFRRLEGSAQFRLRCYVPLDPPDLRVVLVRVEPLELRLLPIRTLPDPWTFRRNAPCEFSVVSCLELRKIRRRTSIKRVLYLRFSKARTRPNLQENYMHRAEFTSVREISSITR